MAIRKFFMITSNYHSIYEITAEFKYYSGFAISQKQKSIQSLHKSISDHFPNSEILEVSSKSPVKTGTDMSAFNLMMNHDVLNKSFPLENVFHSSKVFENGGPYDDLLCVSPGDAKKDRRLTSSGKLLFFRLYNTRWPIEPKSLFYDWLYINALDKQQKTLINASQYNIFTDIEFNHNKSINCQARSAALSVCLYKTRQLEKALSSDECFLELHQRILKSI